jgi:hypothetical protein
MYAQGVRGVMRYLETLDATEADGILDAGLALAGVMYADHFDGKLGASRAVGAGLLPGTGIASDLESYHLSAVQCRVSLNLCAHDLVMAAYVAGLYNGMEQPLSAEGLGNLAQNRYWKSASNVVMPTLAGKSIGYSLVQHFGDPKDHTVNWRHVMRGGVNVDVNHTCADNLGRRWPFTIDAREAPTSPELPRVDESEPPA